MSYLDSEMALFMSLEKYLLFYNKFILQFKKNHVINKIYKYLEDTMNNKLNIFVKTILDLCFYFGLLAVASVPFTLRFAVQMTVKTLGDSTEYAAIADHFWYAVISIMAVGVFTLLILFELRKMMKTVIEDNCFVEANVKSLYHMGTYAFVITGIKTLRCFVYFTPAAMVIAGVFLFAGLFSKVLARVFDRAVTYKQENDLTI